MIIKNALIYTPRHTFEEGSLTIREGRIVPFAQPEEGEEIVDAKGAYALPGLVDIHFHGAMGKDFCDGNEEAIQTLADFEAGKGVLAICPATMTFSEEILNGVMDAAAAHQNGRGADLVGINMEGPFISPNKVGAQNPEYLHKADVAMFRRLQKRANGLIKLVDIAPEEPGALEFIAACHDEVRISIAHTCTSYDTANAAFDAGATHMTHLYNVCFAGEDITPGKCLVPAGTRLDEVSLGLLAGQGVQTVTVYAKPRAALMPTGDELCSPETPLRPGKIYDSNGPMLAARMLRLGAEPTLLAAGPDDPAALAGKLARLLAEYPLVITTGGVSVGDRDYLPQAAEEAGAKLLFYGIDAKPGTPALAAGKDGHVLLCLSGNPFASFATFELLARPALAKLQGADPAPVRVRAALANGFGKPSPLRRFVRATLMGGVVTLPKGGHFSGGIGALAGCNCLVDVPAGSRALNAGDEVEVILL